MHKIIIELVNGSKIVKTTDREDYKTYLIEMLRVMKDYPTNFINLEQFLSLPSSHNEITYIRGDSVCCIKDTEEKEKLNEHI